MAYAFDPAAPLSRNVRRVARDRLDGAVDILDRLRDGDAGSTEEAVHEVRKRCTEVRALARLVRSPLGDHFDPFNATVRDAADVLAPIRDAQAVLATLDELRAVGRMLEPELERVHDIQAAAAQQAARDIHRGDALIERARESLLDARKRVRRWQLPDGFDAIGPDLERGYRRGRRALRAVVERPTDENVHEWRKSVKTLWYQMRLLEPSAPSVLAPVIETLDPLGEGLGDDHDLAVLVERLAADPHRYGGALHALRAIEIARGEQVVLRRPAFRIGATIYAEKPAAFVARFDTYWKTAVENGPELATGGITELAAEAAKRAKAEGKKAKGEKAKGKKARRSMVALVPPPQGEAGLADEAGSTPRAQLAN